MKPIPLYQDPSVSTGAKNTSNIYKNNYLGADNKKVE